MCKTSRTLALGAIALTALACSAREIVWEESVEAAMSRSQRDSRPVLLYFTYHG